MCECCIGSRFESLKVHQKTYTNEKKVSATNAQGPPVPIPNTEVKLCSAEDTKLEAAWENRSMPTSPKAERLSANKTLYGGVAQLGEHLPCKQGVMGSNPIISTTSGERVHRKSHMGS